MADVAVLIEAGEVVLPCEDLQPNLTFFTERLGFRLDAIFPADNPRVATISGYGLRLRLEGAEGGEMCGPRGLLRLRCHDPAAIAGGQTSLTAPNGTRIELAAVASPPALPPLSRNLVVSKVGTDADWQIGRAGMRYRDVIPGRLDGGFIASHIKIAEGGPVPDYVHFHKISFQMIYCYKGWVRVVYEDQGEPFVMQPGDCVLQPPEIRHRVLESSPGLEVVEVGCPAEHLTCVDHDLCLPTGRLHPERDFGGQRFVHHQAADAAWGSWRLAGFEARDTGIEAATGGLARVRVARPIGPAEAGFSPHEDSLLFIFILKGSLLLDCEGREDVRLGPGDAAVLPSGKGFRLAGCSDDAEILEVCL